MTKDDLKTTRNWEACVCGEFRCDYEEDVGYWHEALDRSYLALDFFAGNVEGHALVQHNKELKEEADKITEAMYNFYQLVAERYDEYEMKNCDHKFTHGMCDKCGKLSD